jgi:hypothetical protein
VITNRNPGVSVTGGGGGGGTAVAGGGGTGVGATVGVGELVGAGVGELPAGVVPPPGSAVGVWPPDGDTTVKATVAITPGPEPVEDIGASWVADS